MITPSDRRRQPRSPEVREAISRTLKKHNAEARLHERERLELRRRASAADLKFVEEMVRNDAILYDHGDDGCA